MASFWDNLYTKYKQGSISIKLIYINTVIFLVLQIFSVTCRMFHWNAGAMVLMLRQPADWTALLYRPWSLFTYMFVHEGFLHLIFNMLWLYFFGKIFLQKFTSKQFLLVYLLGGICGGLFYALGYHIFPYYESAIETSLLSGSSAAVFAIAIAIVFYQPNQSFQLAFFGHIKIKWLVIIMIVMDILSLAGENAGGSFAHLGGAFFGMLYGLLLRPKAAWNPSVKNVFQSRRKADKKTKYHRSNKEQTNIDQAYRDQKKAEEDRRDAILDKIKESGYNSLSKEDKAFLFHMSDKD